MVAAEEGQTHILDLLLKQGADKEAASEKTGYRCLHISAEKGCIDVVRLLIRHKVMIVIILFKKK
jgi:ankyrin repeat protein